MSSDQPDPKIEFELAFKDRQLLVNHSLALPGDLDRRLRLGTAVGSRLRYIFPLSDFETLLDVVAAEAGVAPTRALERRFSRLFRQLDRRLAAFFGEEEAVAGGAPFALPPDLERSIEELLDRESFASIEELNERLSGIMQGFNQRPVAEFSGLSPFEVQALVYADWSDPEGLLELNQQLPEASLIGVEIFANARLFLRTLLEEGGTKATAAGNLNRRFVGRMVEKMAFQSNESEWVRSYLKKWNEGDFGSLHTLRIVLTLAGLIRKYRGSFRITQKGERLIGEKASGELYTSLFLAYFQKFDLGYASMLPEMSIIQDGMAISLLMLSRWARDWVSPEVLAVKLFLPWIRGLIEELPFEGDFKQAYLETYIVSPLLRFGLLEVQRTERRTYGASGETIRTSPLFDAFLTFHLDRC